MQTTVSLPKTIFTQCHKCRRVKLTPKNRCDAIQELVRPREVAHLIQIVPSWSLPSNQTFATSVACWMREKFQSGELHYIADSSDSDRWCPPTCTLLRGGGDCDDLAILNASMLLFGGVSCDVVVGSFCDGPTCTGHAWVEGYDQFGFFLLESTNGALYRGVRPHQYEP